MVAENLGVMTPEVEALRREFGFPGMSLLQFAFGNDPQGPSFRPHHYMRELAAYTGGHDNDTTVGWWLVRGWAKALGLRKTSAKNASLRKRTWDVKTKRSIGF